MLAAAVGALVAGVLGGLAARLLMRGVAVAVGVDTSFTLVATVMITVVFVVLAVPAAITATARPGIRRGGRWVTVLVTGWTSARTGFADAKSILLAEEERLPVLAALAVAFAAVVTAHGRFAQWLTRRLATSGEPARPYAANLGHPEPGAEFADGEAFIRGSCQSPAPPARGTGGH
ncbi:hypothetical protein ABT340_34915 [Streptosporangium sp. NPDC000239]|uniref:hypothetical protein n=1 Tax=Streptosporangium sp. NPDC000239 TaxID=3154248 RepID=UPI00331E74E0